ncbi:hypothetical protein PGTUg99_002139 [Puccinia graminis f. sp. tritici]|uniref:Retrotransposon gag domain-containing protein n=1 Tax=Puccinia graminis f. sp. tritici TaxID=56615 RepID=A0A5B0M647_PUCGR|nr:hypothetical protein PGTUg99_002139 [Puccinia graminis f. sp. tritici]
MLDTIPPPRGQEQLAADSTRDSTRTANGSDMSTAKEWFKAVLKVQHPAITQAQEDRQQALEDCRADRKLFLDTHQANSDRICRLEDLLLVMNIKNEIGAQAKQPAPGQVDLQKFCTSDGPTYCMAETNLQSLYANEASSFLNKSWEEFKTRMVDFELPNNWCSGLQRQIRKLDMSPTKSFLEYSTRARTLQSLFNFDAKKFSKLGDLQLAQFVVYGLPDTLQDRINKHQLLEASPFAYGCDVFIWQVHTYLDLQGLCHFCKKHCGGACPRPIDRSHINIPSTFQTPTKALDYVAPRACSRPATDVKLKSIPENLLLSAERDV